MVSTPAAWFTHDLFGMTLPVVRPQVAVPVVELFLR